MNIWEYLEKKQQKEARDEYRRRLYFDIGCCLWYDVAFGDVLSYKGEKIEQSQNAPFLTGQAGDRYFVYGLIKALKSKADIDKFEKSATAELKDRLNIKVAVKVYPSSIVVQFFK